MTATDRHMHGLLENIAIAAALELTATTVAEMEFWHRRCSDLRAKAAPLSPAHEQTIAAIIEAKVNQFQELATSAGS